MSNWYEKEFDDNRQYWSPRSPSPSPPLSSNPSPLPREIPLLEWPPLPITCSAGLSPPSRERSPTPVTFTWINQWRNQLREYDLDDPNPNSEEQPTRPWCDNSTSTSNTSITSSTSTINSGEWPIQHVNFQILTDSDTTESESGENKIATGYYNDPTWVLPTSVSDSDSEGHSIPNFVNVACQTSLVMSQCRCCKL